MLQVMNLKYRRTVRFIKGHEDNLHEHRGKYKSLRLTSEPVDDVFTQVIPWEAEVIIELLLSSRNSSANVHKLVPKKEHKPACSIFCYSTK